MNYLFNEEGPLFVATIGRWGWEGKLYFESQKTNENNAIYTFWVFVFYRALLKVSTLKSAK